jgi:16S rRNA (adenine1518-N6/adenine1519-N6)-dimethyltransferase
MSNRISPNNIKSLLEASDLSAQKRLGQNFLHDNNIIDKMISAGKAGKEDVVLEIGPGLGTITKPLAKIVKEVIAIEKDPRIADWLTEDISREGLNNIRIIKGDALEEIGNKDSQLNTLLPKEYKVIANIPYYLTSHLIRILLEKEEVPSSITLMIQKEVAERICSKKGNSILSISASYYADSHIDHIVSKNCFHPKPKVDSAIITLTPKKRIVDKDFDKVFFLILKTGFSSPRKQILKNLSSLGDRGAISGLLEKCNISPERRAETLSLEEWKKIASEYSEANQS